jgi:flagellar assembly protein FliH
MPDQERTSRIVEGAPDLPRPFTDDDQNVDAVDPIDEALARGRAEGLAEGERRAAEAHEQQLHAVRDEVAGALKELGELRVKLTREHKALMIELALEAASRIVRERIEADDPVAARALAEAVEALPSGETIQARLHPEDVEAVKRDLADLVAGRRIELLADQGISRGGCVVDSGAGRIDATLETADAEIRAAAAGEVERP